jgi:hypothetical protein
MELLVAMLAIFPEDTSKTTVQRNLTNIFLFVATNLGQSANSLDRARSHKNNGMIVCQK